MCWSFDLVNLIASTGQHSTQVPHSMQESGCFTKAVSFVAITGGLTGHTWVHSPHAMHLALLIFNTFLPR